ncbi:MAG: ORF6N domain-containing protein [Bacteroidetes bacterium]|nr:ORF6N domain-containing protein [Bacteroidota bacterium]
MDTLEINEENILHRIFYFRGKKVMLDNDLANIYGVTTTRLNEQVKRNKKRFPEDFMFQLTHIEWTNLISQNATSSPKGKTQKWGGRRKFIKLVSDVSSQTVSRNISLSVFHRWPFRSFHSSTSGCQA